jgi:S1-C subfamily serine protease
MRPSLHTICQHSILLIAIVVVPLLIMGVLTVYADEPVSDEERSLKDVLFENELLRAEIADLEAELEYREAAFAAQQNQEPPPGQVEVDPAEYEKLIEDLQDLEAQNDTVQTPLDQQNQLAKDLIAVRTALLIGRAKEFDDGSDKTASGLRDSVLLFSQSKQVDAGYWEGGIATAFLIEPDLAVTNSHNVRSADGSLKGGQITLFPFQGEPIKASIVGDNPAADIALLRLEKPSLLPALKWGDVGSMSAGDPIFTIGNPGMMGSWVTHIGLIKEIKSVGDYTEVRFSAPCMKGCSGSPIFNMNGEVVAVLFGSLPDDGGYLPLQLHTSLRFLKGETGLSTSAQDASSLVTKFLSEEGSK